MSDEILSPIELGFAEFVAKLISEIFDATISSQAQQQEKLIELNNMLMQPEENFLQALLEQDYFIQEVDLLLQGYFPVDDDHALHAIYEGAPYQAAKGNTPEQPALLEKLGLSLNAGDINSKKKQLTQQGVNKIYQKAGQPLAVQKRAIFKQLVENGLPNIAVESGKINAKLTFNTNVSNHASNTGDTPKAATAKTASAIKAASINKHFAPLQPVNRLVGLIKPNINNQVRLTVKQASNKSPQDTQATANIFSEVEIHFKTIS